MVVVFISPNYMTSRKPPVSEHSKEGDLQSRKPAFIYFPRDNFLITNLIIVVVEVIIIICTRDRIQDLMFASQALIPLSYLPGPLIFF